LTDGQGRALSAHKSQQAYQRYAKRTTEPALAATRKRRAHRLATTAGTGFQHALPPTVQNEGSDDNAAGAQNRSGAR
jgi:hypothetical protein